MQHRAPALVHQGDVGFTLFNEGVDDLEVTVVGRKVERGDPFPVLRVNPCLDVLSRRGCMLEDDREALLAVLEGCEGQRSVSLGVSEVEEVERFLVLFQ